MADEQETYAESGPDTATAQAEETTNTLEADDGDAPEAQDADEPTNDNIEDDDDEGAEGGEGEGEEGDLVELDFAFGKYSVPPKLRDAVKGLEKTFTQKTQEYNEQVRQLTAKASQRAEANEEELGLRAQLHTTEAELKRFENWDWNAYQAFRLEDPLKADEAWAYKHHLADQQAKLKGQLQERETSRSQEAQQDLAKRIEETRQFAQKEIKGWSDEMDSKLLQFAMDQDIPEDFLRSNLSPTFYKILHRAWVGEQALAKQAAAPKPKPQPTPQPTRRVSAKANPGSRKPLEEWTPEDHARAMRARGR